MNQDDRLLLVGRVAGGFGVRGEVRITAYTADPMALAAYGELKRADGSPALTILSARPAKGGVTAKVKEAADKDQADALKGLRLFIPRALLPLPDEDEFYLADLVGLEARDGAGTVLGNVKDVHDYGAGDILEIQPVEGGHTWLVPFTREAAPEVKVAEGFVVIVRPDEVE